jgi:sugar O-acyltransferase (sialic acid O-acetyltransferase NeuD family)
MPKTKLLIIGAGGHGASVAEAADLSGSFEVIGFLDDALPVGQMLLNRVVLGGVGALSNLDRLGSYRAVCDEAIVAVGNNALRREICAQLQAAGFLLARVVHPRAFVSPRAQLGEGVTVMAGAIVGPEAVLGQGVIVNCGAVVDHHAQVHDFGHLGVNACMAGGSVLGALAWMQAGSAIGYGVQLDAGKVLKPNEAV